MRNIFKTIALLQIMIFIGSCNTDDDLSYTCNSGNCAEDPDGAFATLAECETACSEGNILFTCASGNCIEDADGNFATLAECESACSEGEIVSNPGGGVTDSDGHSYTTVVLGNGQEWMAENLRSAAYANGDPVPSETTQNLQSLTTGAWAHYDDDDQFDAPYGKLYNWYAASDSRNVCPVGWHVPSLSEFIELAEYLDPDVEVVTVNQVLRFTSLTGGGLLKSVGTDQWDEPNTGATDESGLSAQPSGDIMYGSSSYMGRFVNWWSTSSHPGSGGNAQTLFLTYSNAEVKSSTPIKDAGFSIRCLKD